MWGRGYKDGFFAAVRGFMPNATDEEVLAYVKSHISKSHKDNAPSMFAVANKCCGGVDAHYVGCRG